jgi:glycosyltransferase involved in cell wall biosynthesis
MRNKVMAERLGPEEPLFSVVVPTYNRPMMLERAVESVRRQGLEDFELIVVDDGSKELDGSVERADPRVRVLRSPVNSGAAAARNLGLWSARGRYISFLDDDDEYLPSFLGATWQCLKDTPPEVGMSWCGVRCVDHSDEPSGEARVRLREFPLEYPDVPSLFAELASIGTGFGVTIKAEVARELGGFNSKLKTVEDTDFFLRLLIAGYLPTIVPGNHVVVHNHHGPRMTGVALQNTRARECQWLLLQYADFLDRHVLIRQRLLLQLSSAGVVATGVDFGHASDGICMSRA